MLFLRFLLMVLSFGFIAVAIGVVLYDVYLAFELDRILRRPAKDAASTPSASLSSDEVKATGSHPVASAATLSPEMNASSNRADVSANCFGPSFFAN